MYQVLFAWISLFGNLVSILFGICWSDLFQKQGAVFYSYAAQGVSSRDSLLFCRNLFMISLAKKNCSNESMAFLFGEERLSGIFIHERGLVQVCMVCQADFRQRGTISFYSSSLFS